MNTSLNHFVLLTSASIREAIDDYFAPLTALARWLHSSFKRIILDRALVYQTQELTDFKTAYSRDIRKHYLDTALKNINDLTNTFNSRLAVTEDRVNYIRALLDKGATYETSDYSEQLNRIMFYANSLNPLFNNLINSEPLLLDLEAQSLRATFLLRMEKNDKTFREVDWFLKSIVKQDISPSLRELYLHYVNAMELFRAGHQEEAIKEAAFLWKQHENVEQHD